jgi:hypothetical protein
VLLRIRPYAWISALWALFLVFGAPWVVYETAIRTQSVVVVIEEEREEHDERVEREVAEAFAPPPPRHDVDAPAAAVVPVRVAESALRSATPACPSLANPARFSVRRLI